MKRILPWLLAAGSGVAMALALPGAGITPLLLVAPGLLLEALERGGGRWRPWLLGFFAGVVHWCVGANWIVSVMHHYGGLPLPIAVACLLLMAAILGVCWACTTGLSALVSSRQRVWLLPCAFIVFDSWRQFWPLRFPWNPPAAALADTPWLLGSLPLWGATGLGWAALTVGAGLWAVVRPSSRRLGATAVATVVGLTGLFHLLAPRGTPEQAVTIGVVQPGTSLEQKWDPSQWREAEERLWRLTRRAAAMGSDVVLWPESAVPYRIESDATYRQLVQDLAAELDVHIVLNSVGGSAERGYTNSVYVVGPDGLAAARYDKVRLVPFGESVPWWAGLAFAEPLVREVGRFEAGAAPVVLDVGVPLGMAICYEVVFADLAAEQVRRGAEVLATVTNDGWYGFSWAPRQHFAQAVLRAVETRRWLVRSALTGISGFVTPEGKVVAKLEVGETGFLVSEVRRRSVRTLRSRFGDWWWVLSAVYVAATLIAVWRRGQR